MSKIMLDNLIKGYWFFVLINSGFRPFAYHIADVSPMSKITLDATTNKHTRSNFKAVGEDSTSASIVKKININVSPSRALALSDLDRSTPVSDIVLAGGHPPEYENYSFGRARGPPQKSPLPVTKVIQLREHAESFICRGELPSLLPPLSPETPNAGNGR